MGQIVDLHVTFISLVKRPATGKAVILRSAGLTPPFDSAQGTLMAGQARCFEVRKMDAALQRVYGIVYAPGEVDSQGDTADAATIRRAATRFLREYNQSNVDVEHSFNSELAGVAESWLVRSGDPLFPEEPDGAWAVGIQIYDPELWQRLEAGELTGLSLAGLARYAEPEVREKSEQPPGWFMRWLGKAVKTVASEQWPVVSEKGFSESIEETPMNEDEIKTLLKTELPALVAATLAAQKSAEAADAEQKAREQELTDLKKSVAELSEQVKQALHKGADESGAGGGEQSAPSLFD